MHLRLSELRREANSQMAPTTMLTIAITTSTMMAIFLTRKEPLMSSFLAAVSFGRAFSAASLEHEQLNLEHLEHLKNERNLRSDHLG